MSDRVFDPLTFGRTSFIKREEASYLQPVAIISGIKKFPPFGQEMQRIFH
jgi:hypothetical protein